MSLTGSTSLLAKMTGNLNERPYKSIKWPGRDQEVVLWRLTPSELARCKRRAFDFVREQLKFSEIDLAWDHQNAKDMAVTIEILSIALRDPNKPENQFCTDSSELWDRVAVDEIQALIEQYNKFAEERSVEHLFEDPLAELEVLTDLAKKGLTLDERLSWYDGVSLRKLLRIAVEKRANLMMRKSLKSSSMNDSAQSQTRLAKKSAQKKP